MIFSYIETFLYNIFYFIIIPSICIGIYILFKNLFNNSPNHKNQQQQQQKQKQQQQQQVEQEENHLSLLESKSKEKQEQKEQKKEEEKEYNNTHCNNSNKPIDLEFELSKLKKMNMFSKKKKEDKLTPVGGTPIVASSSTSSGSLMSGINNGDLSGSTPQSPQPFAGRSCSFKKFGCSQYIVSKNELDNHMKEDAQFHLQLVVEKFDHQFDLHTQLMAHFTEQMEDQLEKIMKVVRNHMDTFGNQIQSKIDEGVEKSITFAKKVEQQQQQLAKRLITQQIVDQKKLSSPLVRGGLSSDGLSVDSFTPDGASQITTQAVKQLIDTEIQLVQTRIKREYSELSDELNKLSDSTTRDRKSVEDTINRKTELAISNIENQILKKLDEKEKRKAETAQVSLDTKIESIRDKLKLIESTQIESSSEIRKLKLESQKHQQQLNNTSNNNNSPVLASASSFSGFVPSLNKENSFQKSEIMEEFKKLEDRLSKKLQEDNNNNKSEIADIQRNMKQSQTDLMDLEKDCKNQFDKQGRQVKQVEDDLKKTDSLVLLMQNNLKKYNEYVEKEKDRESERFKLLDQIKQLEISQKRIEAEIQEGNEQVERVLREESNNNNVNGNSVGSMSPISSISKSPLLIKRSSMIISSPPLSSSSPKSTETKSTQPSEDGENGILWEYDPVVNKWTRMAMKLKVERKAFAEGALREAYHTVSLGVTSDEAYPLGTKHSFPSIESISPSPTGSEAYQRLKSGTKFVLKLYKKEAEAQVSRELYFEDVKMQMVCRDWGHKFNQKKPPKKIEFLMSWVVELVDRNSNSPVLCCIEPLLVGEFKKNNSNYGAVLNNRSTPQAFSHFTYENSNKQIIIVDIQGVDDLYTDPQVHTNDGKGYGLGNLGKTGINKFITTHKCNAVCALLDLDVKLGGVLQGSKKQLQGTMVMPDIASELDQTSGENEFNIKIGAKELPKAEFNRKELKCINTIPSFRERVNCITFFDNKKLICAGYGDGQFRVFDIKDNYKCIHTTNGHRKSIESICANSQYLFTSSPDHSIKVHSLRSASGTKCVETLIGHTGEVSSIVCNEKYLFSCSYDKTIKVWDLSTFKETKSFDGVHTKYIKTLCLSGRYLFSGGNDQTIYVWDTENMTCLFNMQGHEDWVLNLHCCGTYLFSTSKDNVIKIWDLNNFHCVETLKGHWNSVCSAVVKDRYLYSGAEDNSIKVWDLDTLECVYTIQKSHSLGVKALLTYDNQLISAAFDGTIKTWDWQSK